MALNQIPHHIALAICIAVLPMLASCEEQPAEDLSCQAHTNSASCLADKACGWRTDLAECKAASSAKPDEM